MTWIWRRVKMFHAVWDENGVNLGCVPVKQISCRRDFNLLLITGSMAHCLTKLMPRLSGADTGVDTCSRWTDRQTDRRTEEWGCGGMNGGWQQQSLFSDILHKYINGKKDEEQSGLPVLGVPTLKLTWLHLGCILAALMLQATET